MGADCSVTVCQWTSVGGALAFWSCIKKGDHFGDRRFCVRGLADQGINTSIEPSAVMLTWLVPASTSGVTGAESMLAAFIIIGPRMYGCG